MKTRRLLMASAATLGAAALALTGTAFAGPHATASSTPGGSESTAAAPSGGGGITIAMITHSDDGIFWSVVKKGAEDAAKALGVTLQWEGSNNDPAKQAQMVEAATANKVSGLAVSLADPSAMEGPVKAAVAAGIPVVTLNSGSDKFKEFGAITHIGQDEKIAGNGAGEKFKAAGAKKVLCVMQEQSNVGLQARCDGAKETFGGDFEMMSTTKGDSDAASSQGEIKAKLEADPSIDAVFATGPVGAVLAVKAAEELGRTLHIGSVDLSEELLSAIEAGTIEFTIDQQQYLQGYLAVVTLYLNITNANTVGGGLPVYTGPGFVTKDNVEAVKALVAKGTR